MTWQELYEAEQAAKAALTAYTGTLRRMRPVAIDRDSQRDFATFLTENVAARRFPKEHPRIQAEMRNEAETARRLAAGAARHQARAIRAAVDEGRTLIAQTRRNVAESFPDALDRVDANGMIMLALLRAQMQPLLAGAHAATLLGTYQSAVARKDARGLVEAEIIEDLVASGAALAADEGDLPLVKQLRELVNDVQDLRLPTSLPDLDALVTDLDRLDSRADLAKVDPLSDDAAAEAFEQQREAIAAAGALSDADDQAALREDVRLGS